MPTPNGVRFFATGAALTLPHLTREREVADCRLLRIDRVSGELRIEDTMLYDSILHRLRAERWALRAGDECDDPSAVHRRHLREPD